MSGIFCMRKKSIKIACRNFSEILDNELHYAFIPKTHWFIFPSMQKHFITFSFSKFSIRLTRSIITLGSVGLLYIPRAKKTTSDWRHCKSSVNPIDNNSRNFGISSLISTGTGLSPPDESVWWVRNGGRSNVLLRRIATPIAKNKC